MQRKDIHVAVAIILDASRRRVLMAQRPPGKIFAGFWEYPGGKIEPGEQPYACICRELKEELDIQVERRKSQQQQQQQQDVVAPDLHFVHEYVMPADEAGGTARAGMDKQQQHQPQQSASGQSSSSAQNDRGSDIASGGSSESAIGDATKSPDGSIDGSGSKNGVDEQEVTTNHTDTAETMIFAVHFDLFVVESYIGCARGAEGQHIEWVDVETVETSRRTPAASRRITAFMHAYLGLDSSERSSLPSAS